MRKLGTGYTMYFNNKNERSSVLFQGRYKAKHVSETTYLTHLVHYVHANPPDDNYENLRRYKWSSLSAYTSIEINPDPTVNSKIIKEIIGDTHEYITDFNDWLKTRDISDINLLMLDE